MMAVTIEELRALLAATLGVANIVVLFLNRALGYEQQAHDKAKVNLEVLQKQAKGLQAEYNRATSLKDSDGAHKELQAKVDSLIRENNAFRDTVEKALQSKRSAEAQVEAIKTQSKVKQLPPLRSSMLAAGCMGIALLIMQCLKAQAPAYDEQQTSAAIVSISWCACMQGLEREYDRLLAEHDRLQAQLQQVDVRQTGTTNKKFS
eukprot:jgi/Chrzof1/9347/UNPLg00318.t1